MSNDMFNNLLGKVVKIDRGGPESRVGQLVAVKDDYYTLLTAEDGLVFYQPHHTKSITQTKYKEMAFESDFLNRFRFMPPRNFQSALDSFQNFNVKINRGGPESVEGVLIDVNCDYVTVMTKDDFVRMALFHIRNISLSVRKKKNKGSSKKQESSSKRSSNRRDRSKSAR